MYQVNFQPVMCGPMWIYRKLYKTKSGAEKRLDKIKKEYDGIYNGFVEPENTGEHFVYDGFECRKI